MQKNGNNINEALFLQKMFKFFDIQNKGKVDFDQFFRAMEKTGIVMDKPVSYSAFLKHFYRISTKFSRSTMSMEMGTWTTRSSQASSSKESSHHKNRSKLIHISRKKRVEKLHPMLREVTTLRHCQRYLKTNLKLVDPEVLLDCKDFSK